MKSKFSANQLALLSNVRRALEPHFGPETAYPGTRSKIASAGHCAIVSAIAALTVGGGLASTTVKGVSHWFNRLSDGKHLWDVDLTGDQFDLPVIQVAPAGKLYPTTANESLAALNVETLQRALVLARRGGMGDSVAQLGKLLAERQAEAAAVHA